jgi:hypothetical protein
MDASRNPRHLLDRHVACVRENQDPADPWDEVRLGLIVTAQPRSTLTTMVEEDPVTSNPAHYRTIFENEFVRVLEYVDEPGESTSPHVHPNSVMVTLSGFQRRLRTDAGERDVDIPAHQVMWLPAQRHAGENIGGSRTHTIFVELKGDAAGVVDDRVLGPDTGP